MKNITALIYCIFIILTISVNSHSEDISDIHFDNYAIDMANILNETELTSLNKTLKELEEQTTCQLFVAIINSLDGQNIDKFSLELANRSYTGHPTKDNEILFLISKNDRAVRIEVGYGLENIITDEYAGQILRNEIIPEFKDGNYYKGIKIGINSVMNELLKPDIKEYFTMPWNILNFELFISKYPDSIQRCEAFRSLGRFYEDVWNDSILKFTKEDERKKSIEYYHKYLAECPNGIWKGQVKYELSRVENKKPDFKRYLIDE